MSNIGKVTQTLIRHTIEVEDGDKIHIKVEILTDPKLNNDQINRAVKVIGNALDLHNDHIMTGN